MKSKPESVWAAQKLWQWKNTTVMITESAGVAEQKNSLVYAHFSVFLWRRAPQNRCGYLHVSRNYTACSCLPQPWTWSIPTQCPQYVPWDASNVLLGVMATDLMNRFLHRTGKVRSWAWKRSSTSTSAGKRLVARSKWGAPASSQRVRRSIVWGSVCDAGTVPNCRWRIYQYV